MDVLFQTNIPSPYRVDFFNELGKKCNLTVVFESTNDKSRNHKWKADKYRNFKAIFLNGIKKGDADAFCPEVIKIIAKGKYDIILIGAYHTPTAMIAMQYMMLKHIPYGISIDGAILNREKPLKYRIKSHFIKNADFWLTTGMMTTEYWEHYGAKLDKIYNYPFTSVSEQNILQQPISQREKRNLRTKLGICEDRMVLSVGQFIYRKGYDVLIKSARRLPNDVGIYIVGGKATEEYLKMLEEYQLQNVHFVDFMTKDELSSYYKASDIFVLPTREDIWGLVINEAMSYALPIVTTNKCVAGMEMVEQGVQGYIVPTDNEELLSEGILKALTGDTMDMATKSLQKARSYTIQNMSKIHIQIFEKVKKHG